MPRRGDLNASRPNHAQSTPETDDIAAAYDADA